MRQGGFLITLINHQMGRIFSGLLGRHGINLNPGEGRILFTIWSNDGISFGDVVKKTLIPKSTLAETLDRLENTGYIRRMIAEDDRRKVLLRITDKTKGFQNTLAKVSDEMSSQFYKGLEPKEIDEFEGYLSRILNNLRE